MITNDLVSHLLILNIFLPSPLYFVTLVPNWNPVHTFRWNFFFKLLRQWLEASASQVYYFFFLGCRAIVCRIIVRILYFALISILPELLVESYLCKCKQLYNSGLEHKCMCTISFICGFYVY